MVEQLSVEQRIRLVIGELVVNQIALDEIVKKLQEELDAEKKKPTPEQE